MSSSSSSSASAPPLPASNAPTPAVAGGGTAVIGSRGVATGSITYEAFLRSGAVQGYFELNAYRRLDLGGRCTHLFEQEDTPGNFLLSNLRVTRLRSYAMQSTPFPTVFLLPALISFTAAGGTNLQAVPIPGAVDVRWSEMDTTFPLIIYGLTRTGTANFTAVYAGQLTRPGTNIHTYTDSELGTGWLIPDKVMNEIDVLVPVEAALAVTLDHATSRVPSLTERFQAPGNASSKRNFVQEDGCDSWDIYVSDRPTAAHVTSSRTMYRAMSKERFADILNATRSLDLQTGDWHKRLLMYSVLSPMEVPAHCKYMGGLYSSRVQYMRIMSCPEALALLYAGKWPQNFRMHELSLWHFMPTQSLGFDYTKSNGDIFSALRAFLVWWSWLSGNISIPALFEPDLMIWQTTHPWSSMYVWVVNVCMEKGLVAWFLYMNSPAEVFKYKDSLTSVVALLRFLTDSMSVESLIQVRDSYDAKYAPMVIYPDAHCAVPNEVPSIRCKALIDPHGPTSPQYVFPVDAAAFSSLSVSQGASKKAKAGVLPGSGDTIGVPKPPLEGGMGTGDGVRNSKVCFANLAHIFDLTMKSTYVGKCTDAKALSDCPAGIHYSKVAKPSASAMLKVIEGSVTTRYGKELRAGLEKANT
jgi:hypothetical protein